MIEQIYSAAALLTALTTPGARILEIRASSLHPASIVLPPGTWLRGGDGSVAVVSFSQGDGIGLTGDNELKDLVIQVNPSQRAIHLVNGRANLGSMRLENLRVSGQTQILLRLTAYDSLPSIPARR